VPTTAFESAKSCPYRHHDDPTEHELGDAASHEFANSPPSPRTHIAATTAESLAA
jgi:hypothetical protein